MAGNTKTVNLVPERKKNASHKHKGKPYDPAKSDDYVHELEYFPDDAAWQLRLYDKCACGEKALVHTEIVYGIRVSNDMPFGIPDVIECGTDNLVPTDIRVNGRKPILIRFCRGE